MQDPKQEPQPDPEQKQTKKQDLDPKKSNPDPHHCLAHRKNNRVFSSGNGLVLRIVSQATAPFMIPILSSYPVSRYQGAGTGTGGVYGTFNAY